MLSSVLLRVISGRYLPPSNVAEGVVKSRKVAKSRKDLSRSVLLLLNELTCIMSLVDILFLVKTNYMPPGSFQYLWHQLKHKGSLLSV